MERKFTPPLDEKGLGIYDIMQRSKNFYDIGYFSEDGKEFTIVAVFNVRKNEITFNNATFNTLLNPFVFQAVNHIMNLIPKKTCNHDTHKK